MRFERKFVTLGNDRISVALLYRISTTPIFDNKTSDTYGVIYFVRYPLWSNIFIDSTAGLSHSSCRSLHAKILDEW